jgi:hypothetical protein
MIYTRIKLPIPVRSRLLGSLPVPDSQLHKELISQHSVNIVEPERRPPK